MRRATKMLVSTDSSRPSNRTTTLRMICVRSGTSTSLNGCSMKTYHPSWPMGACTARTSPPCRPSVIVKGRSSACALRGLRLRGEKLRRLREVALLQHQADVGMRDQPALGVGHVGVPGAADPDLGHDVPDRLEVDLRYRHFRGGFVQGHRDRHIGLGLVPEIDRAEESLLRLRHLKLRGRGIVLAAVRHVQCDARYAEPLLAGDVQMTDIGDGGSVPQQPEEVDFPLASGRGSQGLPRPLRPRTRRDSRRVLHRGIQRPAHIAFQRQRRTARSGLPRPGPFRAPGRRSRAWFHRRKNTVPRGCWRSGRRRPGTGRP